MLAAVHLRLAILGPLLPLVYADREADAARNLRCRLLRALLKLCCALDCCLVWLLSIGWVLRGQGWGFRAAGLNGPEELPAARAPVCCLSIGASGPAWRQIIPC